MSSRAGAQERLSPRTGLTAALLVRVPGVTRPEAEDVAQAFRAAFATRAPHNRSPRPPSDPASSPPGLGLR